MGIKDPASKKIRMFSIQNLSIYLIFEKRSPRL